MWISLTQNHVYFSITEFPSGNLHQPGMSNFDRLTCYQESHQMVQGRTAAIFPTQSARPSEQEWEIYDWRQKYQLKNSIWEHSNLQTPLSKSITNEEKLQQHPTSTRTKHEWDIELKCYPVLKSLRKHDPTCSLVRLKSGMYCVMASINFRGFSITFSELTELSSAHTEHQINYTTSS